MENSDFTSIMEGISCIQSEFLGAQPLETRKRLGQFFTGETVSDYMASLIKNPESDSVRILDAGAGSGILTASTAFKLLKTGCKSVHAVLYELDNNATPYLERVMQKVEAVFNQNDAVFSYEIRSEDFILARPDKDRSIASFDLAVINPPYFKYSAKNSSYAQALSDLYSGDPNIYASFMAVALACIKEGGQMISITPRSFTNGLYFKGFRSYILEQSALDLVHIFKHRDKVFKNKDSSVLQENIICSFVKGSVSENVVICASDCDSSISSTYRDKYPLPLIVDPTNDQKIIRIPESYDEANILKEADSLPTTFKEAGYFISTGRVVEHRSREYITEDTEAENVVPLYRPHNVTPLNAMWDGRHKKDVSFMLIEGHEKHTMKNGTFVLLKRFSSKDEKRRLVAGVHIDNTHDYEWIGFGNKTNYIGLVEEKLTATESYGLASVFNSTFMDRYFRCLSGNTQVNATEIRVMKFPSRAQVQEIGKQIQDLSKFEANLNDLIVNSVLGVKCAY